MPRYPSITERNLTKGFQEIYYYANEVTDSWISNMILIGVFAIVFMGVYLSRKDFAEGFAVAGFVTFIIGTLFWFAEFISATTLTVTIAISLLGFIILWFSKKSY